jgi:hypothetical protein
VPHRPPCHCCPARPAFRSDRVQSRPGLVLANPFARQASLAVLNSSDLLVAKHVPTGQGRCLTWGLCSQHGRPASGWFSVVATGFGYSRAPSACGVVVRIRLREASRRPARMPLSAQSCGPRGPQAADEGVATHVVGGLDFEPGRHRGMPPCGPRSAVPAGSACNIARRNSGRRPQGHRGDSAPARC